MSDAPTEAANPGDPPEVEPNPYPRYLWTFTGEADQDVEDWIKRCRYTAWMKASWHDQVGPITAAYSKLFEVIDHIDGPAKAWFDELDGATRADFDKILEAMAKRYSKPPPSSSEDKHPVDEAQASRAVRRRKARERLQKPFCAHQGLPRVFTEPEACPVPEEGHIHVGRLVDHLAGYHKDTDMRVARLRQVGRSTNPSTGATSEKIVPVRSSDALPPAGYAQASLAKSFQQLRAGLDKAYDTDGESVRKIMARNRAVPCSEDEKKFWEVLGYYVERSSS